MKAFTWTYLLVWVNILLLFLYVNNQLILALYYFYFSIHLVVIPVYNSLLIMFMNQHILE